MQNLLAMLNEGLAYCMMSPTCKMLKKKKAIEKDIRFVVTRAGVLDEGGQKLQASSNKISEY